MKRAFSPAFFVLAVAMFFLPFVTVSCNADALKGFGEGFAEGLGEGAVPGDLPQGEVEILSATGWQMVTDSAELSPEAASLGGASSSDGEGLEDVQPFAIAAFGLAALGIFLSLLRGKVGPTLALALGVGGAIALLLLKSKFEGRGGLALGAAGLEISWKPAFWAALLLLIGAAVAGLLSLVMDRAPAVPAMPPDAGMMPTGTPAPPAAGGSPPPAPSAPPPVSPAPPAEPTA